MIHPWSMVCDGLFDSNSLRLFIIKPFHILKNKIYSFLLYPKSYPKQLHEAISESKYESTFLYLFQWDFIALLASLRLVILRNFRFREKLKTFSMQNGLIMSERHLFETRHRQSITRDFCPSLSV